MTFLQNIKNIHEKNERIIIPGAFLVGFLFDSLTLNRIDALYENIVMLSYLFMAGAGIVVFNFFSVNVVSDKMHKFARFLPFLVQFAFGGLFSGYLVFYLRSATLTENWLFIFILALFLFGTEYFKKLYMNLAFQVSVFYIAVFSFLIFYVPIALHTISAKVFIISGLVSVVLICTFIFFIKIVAYPNFKQHRKALFGGMFIIFLSVNFLYFTNIIPPVPLSLKDSGVYNFIERTEDGYSVYFEQGNWYEKIIPGNDVFRLTEGEPVYFYSAVFAPTDLNTKILHKWQYKDDDGMWRPSDILGFQIIGGRDGGYRGFTYKRDIWPGLWRVDVITKRGQILGRHKFRVSRGGATPVLQMKNL